VTGTAHAITNLSRQRLVSGLDKRSEAHKQPDTARSSESFHIGPLLSTLNVWFSAPFFLPTSLPQRMKSLWSWFWFSSTEIQPR
jgi:hypothetical protein